MKKLPCINEDSNENITNNFEVIDFKQLSNLQDESLKIDFHPCNLRKSSDQFDKM